MSNNIHKGTELNNVKETWRQNEKEQSEKEQSNTNNPSSAGETLDRTIKKEASEYDRADKEERLLTGDRASVNDEGASEE